MAKLFVYGVNARCPRDILEGEFARCGEVTDVYITEKGYVKLFFSALRNGSSLIIFGSNDSKIREIDASPIDFHWFNEFFSCLIFVFLFYKC